MKKHFSIEKFCNNNEISKILDYYDALEEYEKCGNLKISLSMLEIMNGNDSSQEIR